MKVILLKDDKNLGKKGELVEINDGYARNFVIPKKIGIEANAANLNDYKLKKANDEKVALKQLEDAKELAETLGKLTVKLAIKTGEGGKSFGSVSGKEIAKGLLDQHKIEIDKKKIVLKEAIKSVGEYNVAVKLHPQVTAELHVSVGEE